jgi:hypothetical protein
VGPPCQSLTSTTDRNHRSFFRCAVAAPINLWPPSPIRPGTWGTIPSPIRSCLPFTIHLASTVGNFVPPWGGKRAATAVLAVCAVEGARLVQGVSRDLGGRIPRGIQCGGGWTGRQFLAVTIAPPRNSVSRGQYSTPRYLRYANLPWAHHVLFNVWRVSIWRLRSAESLAGVIAAVVRTAPPGRHCAEGEKWKCTCPVGFVTNGRD